MDQRGKINLHKGTGETINIPESKEVELEDELERKKGSSLMKTKAYVFIQTQGTSGY